MLQTKSNAKLLSANFLLQELLLKIKKIKMDLKPTCPRAVYNVHKLYE